MGHAVKEAIRKGSQGGKGLMFGNSKGARGDGENKLGMEDAWGAREGME